jgi:hypothetical protein
MRRRTVLTGTGTGLCALAGCATLASDRDLPDDCPTTRDLGVEIPDDLDADSVASFVEAYEAAYYREVVVNYEPESSVDEYRLDGRVTGEPQSVSDGWIVEYDGSGGVYRPTLYLRATTADAPEGADVVPASEIDDAPVTDTVEAAAETGEAEHHVDSPGEEVARYLELFESLSDDFRELSGPGDSDSLYVDVDGTTVELTVQASSFHGDYWWSARYYVDEHVVRRTDDEGVDPQSGTLLECRTG